MVAGGGAGAAGVSERTAWKWVDRFRREGEAGLEDRSSAPSSVPSRTPAEREQLIVLLRELRFTSPEIAQTLGMPLSTVGAVLTRNGLGKMPRLESDEPANSYERPRPGELLHIDVKKLAKIGRPGHRVNADRTTRMRGIGWEYVHVAVDVDRPRFRGQRVVRQLFVLLSFSRSRPATGSRAWSGA